MGMTRKGKYAENQESRIGRKSETNKKRQKHVKKLRIYSVQLIGRSRL
jgi:hypothetical protein